MGRSVAEGRRNAAADGPGRTEGRSSWPVDWKREERFKENRERASSRVRRSLLTGVRENGPYEKKITKLTNGRPTPADFSSTLYPGSLGF